MGSSGATGGAGDIKVEIIGLAQFQKELRRMGPEFPKELQAVNLAIAQRVARKASAKAKQQGGVRAKSAPALSARGEQRNASIKINGSKRGKYPFSLGAEFGALRRTKGKKLPGGARGPRKIIGGFSEWRGNQWVGWGNNGVGYFLHPTIRAEREQIMRDYESMIDALAKRAFS